MEVPLHSRKYDVLVEINLNVLDDRFKEVTGSEEEHALKRERDAV